MPTNLRVQSSEFIDETVKICLEIQKEKGVKLKDFLIDIEKNQSIIELRSKVNDFSKDLYFPC